jgi:hypothetical protein
VRRVFSANTDERPLQCRQRALFRACASSMSRRSKIVSRASCIFLDASRGFRPRPGARMVVGETGAGSKRNWPGAPARGWSPAVHDAGTARIPHPFPFARGAVARRRWRSRLRSLRERRESRPFLRRRPNPQEPSSRAFLGPFPGRIACPAGQAPLPRMWLFHFGMAKSEEQLLAFRASTFPAQYRG